MLRVGRLRQDTGISIARPTALGNPFVVGEPYTRSESISRYRDWFAAQVAAKSPEVMAQLERIVAAASEGDVTLLCHCAPLPCHGEVVVDYVEQELQRRATAKARKA